MLCVDFWKSLWDGYEYSYLWTIGFSVQASGIIASRLLHPQALAMASSMTVQVGAAHQATNEHLRALDVSVTAVALAFVILRFLSRWQRHLKIGVDDI